jgi:F0F1-type ATP synthase assembly protein I
VSAQRRKRTAASLRRIADASSLGLAFPIAILLGYLWGRFMDRALSTAPWFTVIFTVIGVAGGFLNAVRTAIRIGREEDEAADSHQDEDL